MLRRFWHPSDRSIRDPLPPPRSSTEAKDIMTPPHYFGTSYKRISLQRFIGYTGSSLLIALAYQYLTVEARPAILAFLFPIFTAITAHFLLWTPCRLPISHCLASAISSYLLGYVAHDFHLHFKSVETLTMPPALVHFLLAFMIISDLEWLRLRFDLAETNTLYPDIGQMCLLPRATKFLFEKSPTTLWTSFATLIRGWRHVLLDVLGLLAFLQIQGLLFTGASATFGVQCTLHSPNDTPSVLESAFWTEGWAWQELLMLQMMRPFRLLTILVIAWLDDLARAYVDGRIDPYQPAGQISLPLEAPPKKVAHIYH